MDICFDPDVILFHLKYILGEEISLTDEQLHEFIRDLKKLIRKDQQRFKEQKENSTSLSTTNKSIPTPSVYCPCHSRCTSSREDSSAMTERSDSSIQSSSSSLEAHVKTSKADPTKQPPLSFIRPWRLKPPPKMTSTIPGKCDPVNLYQQYQEQWKQIHVPGESALSKLRWNVRERMLGQDPQPRGINSNFEQVSSNDSKQNDPCPVAGKFGPSVAEYNTNNSPMCPCINCKSKVPEMTYKNQVLNENVPHTYTAKSVSNLAHESNGANNISTQCNSKLCHCDCCPDRDEDSENDKLNHEMNKNVEQTERSTFATKSSEPPNVTTESNACQVIAANYFEARKIFAENNCRICTCKCCLKTKVPAIKEPSQAVIERNSRSKSMHSEGNIKAHKTFSASNPTGCSCESCVEVSEIPQSKQVLYEKVDDSKPTLILKVKVPKNVGHVYEKGLALLAGEMHCCPKEGCNIRIIVEGNKKCSCNCTRYPSNENPMPLWNVKLNLRKICCQSHALP